LENDVPRDPHSYPEITVDFSKLPKSRLETMLTAGVEVVECIRALSKTGDNIVGELLRGTEGFYEWDHYPTGNVYDHESQRSSIITRTRKSCVVANTAIFTHSCGRTAFPTGCAP